MSTFTWPLFLWINCVEEEVCLNSVRLTHAVLLAICLFITKKKRARKQQESFQHCFFTYFITPFFNVINTGQRYCGHRIRLMGTFRSEYEYKIKYEYDFQISKWSRPQNALTFPLLSNRKLEPYKTGLVRQVISHTTQTQ